MTVPDIWVGEHSRNKFRNKKRPKIISPNPGLDTICEDQCIVMLESMSIHKSTKVKPERLLGRLIKFRRRTGSTPRHCRG